MLNNSPYNVQMYYLKELRLICFFFSFFFCQYIITVITIVVFRASVGEKHQTKKKNLYVGIYFLALHGQKSDFTMSA